MSFEDAIKKAHSAGLDHKLLQEEGFEDPVGWEERPDESLIVSSGEDEDLSE